MVSKNKRLLQRLRVPLGFLFAIVFIVFSKPTVISLVVGTLIALVGVLVRAWASGHIRKAKELAVSGPYAYTRNPLYLGSFILAGGLCLASGVWWIALAFAVLYLGIYLPVMRVEAEDLTRIFGESFTEYAQNVPLFIPRFSAWKKSELKFEVELYLQYREYRAAIGLALVAALLVGKILFFQ